MSTGPGRDSAPRGAPSRAERPSVHRQACYDDSDGEPDFDDDPDSGCPPELIGVPIETLIAAADAEAAARASQAVPEVFGAGFLPRTPASVAGSTTTTPATTAAAAGPDQRPVSGFASGGVLDVLEPGPALAGLADAATRTAVHEGLAELSDDELIGVMRAWRRLGSWCAAGELATVAELARRRPADGAPPARRGEFPPVLSEFVSDEVAAALALSAQAADKHLGLALDLATRLPGTAEALRAGVIDYLKARVIAEAVTVLDDAGAARVEAKVLPRAGEMTAGQLRVAISRAVLAVDPEAATRRRERAQQRARVERWREQDGTAALCGRDLPPADTLAADQRITARAAELKDAGLDGTMDELRARAYLEFLLGRLPDGQDGNDRHDGDADAGDAPPDPDVRGAGTARSVDQPAGVVGTAVSGRLPAATASWVNPCPAAAPWVNLCPATASWVNLTVPLTTLLGISADPGDVAGFGALDAATAADLARAAAAHPASRWQLTVTDENGTAVGHGHVRRGRSRGAAANAGQGLTLPDRMRVTIERLMLTDCDHRRGEPGYEPSDRLRRLIVIRNATCSFPGCRRPATRCDQDHTVPYDKGGRTCECNMAPLCRRHHRLKQSQGWRLEQPTPGSLTWTAPSGRRHIRGPTQYPT